MASDEFLMTSSASSRASLPSATWRIEWSRVLAERDHVSCQQSGPHGPPFAPGLKAERTLLRWLPWNWGSIDGTGWCYDISWDEIRPCEEIEGVVALLVTFNFYMCMYSASQLLCRPRLCHSHHIARRAFSLIAR